MKLQRKFAVCFGSWLISFCVYLVLLNITGTFADDVLFFRACLISLASAICSVAIWRKFVRGGEFESFLIYVCCVLLLLVFTVFGPTFVDRSVSYHMVFLAAETEKLDMNVMEEIYSQDMLQKRVEDELKSGMICHMGDQVYGPTWKAKIATRLLKPIGYLTNTLDTYEQFKNEMETREKDLWK